MAKIDPVRVVKRDKYGDCVGCGGSGYSDPACDVCGISDVNNLTFGDFTFEVFETEGGGIGFTVYEKGETRANEEARCVDILVRPDLSVVGG